jgi:hypothetical protein
MSARICAIILVVSQIAFAASQQYAGEQTLETIREMVARNEDLASLIKMNYEVTYSRTAHSQESQESQIESGRQRGRQYSHYKSVWAQDGIKQFFDTNYYFSPDESESSSSTQIVDGEVMKKKWSKSNNPDQINGKIDYFENFRWSDIKPSYFSFRPFEGKHLLSEILVQEFASIHDDTEMIDGREAYVINAKRPDTPVYFGRIWIDCERGIPLRFEYYDKDPAVGQVRLTSRTDSIETHQLPNGGWIAVKGVSTYFFYPNRETSMHIFVDVNSVTIEKEDIPDSLFTLEFPEGASIYNAITGITTKAGRVEDRELEAIIDESIEALVLDASPAIMPSSEQAKQEAKDSQQVPNKLPVHEPTLSENEKTTGALADVNPDAVRSYSIVWILLPAFLAAFALTILILMFRSPSRNIVRRDVK